MPNILLGKLPARVDNRTIRLSTILKTLPPLPSEYDVAEQLSIQDTRVFGNDVYGDCVLASAAHQQMRFEKFEQGQHIDISDEDVIAQYLKVTNNEEKGPGMVMLDWLKMWRKEGFLIGGKYYKIHAFGSINWKDHEEVKAVIYLLRGVYLGIMLPRSAQTQFDAGQMWTVDPSIYGSYGSWGGHAMNADAYKDTAQVQAATSRCPFFDFLRKKRPIVGWDSLGPKVMTWGKRQAMTWEFWDRYCEEAYGVVDERNEWLDPAVSPLNVELMEQTLKEITM